MRRDLVACTLPCGRFAADRVLRRHDPDPGLQGRLRQVPGFFIEAWNEHGWWYAEGLGFGIRSKGNVLDQVANDVRKKVHARVVAHYRFKTGVDWTFGDPDDFLDLEFTLGVDPSPDDFAP